MPKFLIAAAILLCGTLTAYANTDQDVINHHLNAARKGDLDEIMKDYAEGSVLIVPHGVSPSQPAQEGQAIFVGKENIRKFFEARIKIHRPASEVTNESVGHETTLVHWARYKGTANESSGMDVVVVRNGKIAFQVQYLHLKGT